MMVNPARSAPQSGCGVDNHIWADDKSPKQTKDHSDIPKISMIDKEPAVAKRRSGFLFKQDHGHLTDSVTCNRKFIISPAIRSQSGIQDFFHQNTVKDRIITEFNPKNNRFIN